MPADEVEVVQLVSAVEGLFVGMIQAAVPGAGGAEISAFSWHYGSTVGVATRRRLIAVCSPTVVQRLQHLREPRMMKTA